MDKQIMNQNADSLSKHPVCRICRKSIEIGAIKCTECDSYQDWRRHFSFGIVALSLSIALISVTTTAIQVTKGLLAKEQSDIRFSLVHYGHESIKIMGSNLGDRAGALRHATLAIWSKDKVLITYNLVWNDVDLVIKPGGWRLFEMKPEKSNRTLTLKQVKLPKENCLYSIKFDVLAFDHSPKSLTIEKKQCPQL
jgi:hypothetical protein